MAAQTLLRLAVSRLKHLGKGMFMYIMFSTEKKIAMTEAALEAGGKGVFASGKRLGEGLFADGTL
jgi:hypothetical protein